ncbi:MAG: 23S rRNA (pseudouridine(1915)-N(3))-methyltransferase RlmH [Burkholderiales bacterium]
MKLVVAAVGHRMPPWIDEGFQEYARRMPRELRLELAAVKPAAGAQGQDKAAEAARLRAAVPDGARLVALDERGKALTTVALAKQLARWREEGRDIAFAIGGADGLDPGLLKEADLVLSLSALTLPHAMVRVVLAEQLYRAWTILQNHPYHRE